LEVGENKPIWQLNVFFWIKKNIALYGIDKITGAVLEDTCPRRHLRISEEVLQTRAHQLIPYISASLKSSTLDKK